MPRSRPSLKLTFHRFRSNSDYERLRNEEAVRRAGDLDRRLREQGLDSVSAKNDPLAAIGTEFDASGRIAKNGYGVLNLSWLAAENPQWAGQVSSEVEELRRAIKKAHGLSLKYMIWAGMGGSAEDKAFYQAAGLLRRRVRVFLLDSTDPAKLRNILDRLTELEKGSLDQALRRTLVVGMAMGMTSYEPVLNLEKLDALYCKLKIDNRSNFIYMTLPDSLLDCFGVKRGFRRIDLQMDSDNTTAGRHSSPLTRGSLYPLALNGCDLAAWLRAAALRDDEVDRALQLAGFLEANNREGRDKLTVFLPRQWTPGAIWTKQDFEESLGKSEQQGIKVVVGEKLKLANYLPPRDERQDRCFLVVQVAGLSNSDPAKVAALRRAGYPVAVLQLSGDAPVARYMQFIHYVVFGLGYLRRMNFVTQPGVELYKGIAAEIQEESQRVGGIEKTRAWRSLMHPDTRVRWRGGLSLCCDPLLASDFGDKKLLAAENGNAAAVFAEALNRAAGAGKISYGDLTFFGDMRYQPAGKRMRHALERAGEAVFRSKLKMPVDIYEGPAMNHSYHEMIIGYGHGFSAVLLAERQEAIRKIQYSADYHRAQWIATQQALARRGRAVVGLTLRDLSDQSLTTLGEFFAEVARRVRKRH